METVGVSQKRDTGPCPEPVHGYNGFSPHQELPALADGGAVVTLDENISEAFMRIERKAQHWRKRKIQKET
jgi:hypothetical protein